MSRESRRRLRREFRDKLRKRQAQRTVGRFFGILIVIMSVVLSVGYYLDTHFGWNIIGPEIFALALGILILIGFLVYIIIWKLPTSD